MRRAAFAAGYPLRRSARWRRYVMLFLLCACSAACQPTRPSPLPTEQPPPASDVLTVRGHYAFEAVGKGEWEVNDFTPCGGTGTEARWWVDWGPVEPWRKVWDFIEHSPEDVLHTESRRVPEFFKPWGKVYVHWRGKLSPVGRYGYSIVPRHKFLILEVYEVRAVTEQDCL